MEPASIFWNIHLRKEAPPPPNISPPGPNSALVGCSDVETEALLEAESDASDAAMDGETEGGGGKWRTMLVLQQRTISSTNKTLVYMQTSLISPWKRRWKQERSSPHSISVSLQIFTSLWNHTSIFLALKAAVKESERERESADKDFCHLPSLFDSTKSLFLWLRSIFCVLKPALLSGNQRWRDLS